MSTAARTNTSCFNITTRCHDIVPCIGLTETPVLSAVSCNPPTWRIALLPGTCPLCRKSQQVTHSRAAALQEKATKESLIAAPTLVCNPKLTASSTHVSRTWFDGLSHPFCDRNSSLQTPRSDAAGSQTGQKAACNLLAPLLRRIPALRFCQFWKDKITGPLPCMVWHLVANASCSTGNDQICICDFQLNVLLGISSCAMSSHPR